MTELTFKKASILVKLTRLPHKLLILGAGKFDSLPTPGFKGGRVAPVNRGPHKPENAFFLLGCEFDNGI